MRAVRLRTEYLTNPLGISYKTPRLSWNCEDGIEQTAYQILAHDEKSKTLWDSGKVASASMRVRYEGTPLTSRSSVFWKVRLWDESDIEGSWSDTACFELGLIQCDDWKARWITGDYKPRKKERYPADCFSTNHYSKGACCEWLFRVMCGVRLTGENHFVIEPKPGGNFTSTKLEYDSVYGTIASQWDKQNDKIIFTIQVPPNCTADIILPDGARETIHTGVKQYICEC